MTYHYLSKEYARQGQCVTMGSGTKVDNYKEYYGDDAIEFIGDKLPDFPVVAGDTIREATKKELVKMGALYLGDNMRIINNEIVEIDNSTHKFVGESVLEKNREDLIADKTITIKSEVERARSKRDELFVGLDILDAKMAVGRYPVSDYRKKKIDEWYKILLAIPQKYSNLTFPIEDMFPETPKEVVYFLKKDVS